MAVALAGTNLIYGAGMLDTGVTFDIPQLMMDNEIIRMIRHFVAGMPVSAETLAIDEIAKVGPFGEFLSIDHTLKHMRDSSVAELSIRNDGPTWQLAGRPDFAGNAFKKAQEVVREYHPQPLSEDVSAEVDQILKKAEEAGVSAAV